MFPVIGQISARMRGRSAEDAPVSPLNVPAKAMTVSHAPHRRVPAYSLCAACDAAGRDEPPH